jgi:hypothetical protein
MNISDVLALQAGTALDAAIDSIVYGNAAPSSPVAIPSYSLDDALALRLVDKCRLFVARIEPAMDKERPFVSGQLTHDPQLSRDVTVLRVSAPTMAIALCKAALLVTLKAQETKRQAIQSSNAVAASAQRVSLRAKAKRDAARPKVTPGGHKGLKARRKAEEAEAKKAAKAAKTAPTFTPPSIQPGFSQPRAFLRVPVEKIPKRREIVIPQP